MFFKKLLKKLKEKKGVTGTDIAAAITVIIFTMGVVTAIYINVTNKVKENIRYSNATRIATQLVENIQAFTYDEFIKVCNESKEVSTKKSEKLLNVNIPVGYSAKVTATKLEGTDVLDIVRDVTVEVSYQISNKTNTITLYTQKQKELLEQTNKPDLSLLSGNNVEAYPIKKTTDGYIVTDIDDPNWYNYDAQAGQKCALVWVVTESKEIGYTLTSSSGGTIYAWIPRYGFDSSNNLTYCYGTSSYKISLNRWTDSKGSVLWAYSLGYKEGSVEAISSYAPSGASVDNTFKNINSSGVWYNLTDSEGGNSDLIKNIKILFDAKAFNISL